MNKLGEEIGGHTYYLFTVNLLKKCGGLITGERLEAEIKKAFSHLWGPEDKRLLNPKRTKWQNMLDWVKSMGTRKELFFTRSRRVKGRKITWIVMPSVLEPLIEWVMGKRYKSSFAKRCDKCGFAQNRMANLVCVKCGKPFPPTTRKIEVLQPRNS